MSRGISYMKYVNERLTGLVTFCVETAFYNRLLKERWKVGIEVTGRRGRRRRKLMDDLKERRGYCHLKEEALDRTVWRALFGRGFGPVARQAAKWMNIMPQMCGDLRRRWLNVAALWVAKSVGFVVLGRGHNVVKISLWYTNRKSRSPDRCGDWILNVDTLYLWVRSKELASCQLPGA